MSFTSTWKRVLKNAASGWSADRCSSMGAAISYYTLFSLGPLLVIAIGIIGMVLGGDARGEVFTQLRGTVGDKAASAIDGILQSSSKGGGATLTIFGFVTLLFGATGVFVELQDALNQVWKAGKTRQGSGIWTFVRTRLLSAAGVLCVGFLLLTSLAVSAFIQAVHNRVDTSWLPGGVWLWALVNLAVTFGFIALMCALAFKYLPRTRVAWGDVWGGALLTAALFVLGKYLLTLYIGQLGVESMYGAAGSVVVVLVWVYYSAQIFLFGAEVTHSYAKVAGSLKDVKEVADCPPEPTKARREPKQAARR